MYKEFDRPTVKEPESLPFDSGICVMEVLKAAAAGDSGFVAVAGAVCAPEAVVAEPEDAEVTDTFGVIAFADVAVEAAKAAPDKPNKAKLITTIRIPSPYIDGWLHPEPTGCPAGLDSAELLISTSYAALRWSQHGSIFQLELGS